MKQVNHWERNCSRESLMTANQTVLQGKPQFRTFSWLAPGQVASYSELARVRFRSTTSPGMMEFNKESDYAGRKSASKRIDVALMNRSQSPRGTIRDLPFLLLLSQQRGFSKINQFNYARMKIIPYAGYTITAAKDPEIQWNTTLTESELLPLAFNKIIISVYARYQCDTFL